MPTEELVRRSVEKTRGNRNAMYCETLTFSSHLPSVFTGQLGSRFRAASTDFYTLLIFFDREFVATLNLSLHC